MHRLTDRLIVTDLDLRRLQNNIFCMISYSNHFFETYKKQLPCVSLQKFKTGSTDLNSFILFCAPQYRCYLGKKADETADQ